MNCSNFASWLENRDTYDLSEAERAMKHATLCANCKELLQKDGELDQFIAKMFQYEKMDERMFSNIDLTLESSPKKTGIKGGIIATAAMMVVTAIFFFLTPNPGNFSSIDEFGKYVLLDHEDHGRTLSLFEKIENLEQWSQGSLHYSFSFKGVPGSGMQMVGGRVCAIKGCSVAHLLYRDKNGYRSLFVVTGDTIGFQMEPGRIYSLTIEGVELRIWQRQEMVYALTG